MPLGSQEPLVKRESAERFGSLGGDEHLVFQLHATCPADGAHITFQAQRHVLAEELVGRVRGLVRVVDDRSFVLEPGAVGHQVVA